MDWPLTGSVAGVVVLAGAVTFGTMAALRTTPEPVKKPPTFVLLLAPPAGTPGYIIASLPSNADDDLRIDSRPLQSGEPAYPPAQKKPIVQRPTERLANGNASQRQSNAGSSPGPDTTSKRATEVAPERWRVTTTSMANNFNLGGHVDKSGIVDSMASEHLREAFKKHRNFEKLPPDMKAHINNSQNISLVKLAPYRKLLGVNDKWLEEEQGVRFERIASNR
jgi:hypothetical protein